MTVFLVERNFAEQLQVTPDAASSINRVNADIGVQSFLEHGPGKARFTASRSGLLGWSSGSSRSAVCTRSRSKPRSCCWPTRLRTGARSPTRTKRWKARPGWVWLTGPKDVVEQVLTGLAASGWPLRITQAVATLAALALMRRWAQAGSCALVAAVWALAGFATAKATTLASSTAPSSSSAASGSSNTTET